MRVFRYIKRDQLASISMLLSAFLGMCCAMLISRVLPHPASPCIENSTDEHVVFSAQTTSEIIPGKLTPPATPVRAVQFLNLDCRTWAEVGERLDTLKAAGVLTVIFRVFHNEGDGFYGFITPAAPSGVYFKTAQCPVVADLLGQICDLSHQRGMRVIAWMTTRYADYGRENADYYYRHEHEAALRCMAWDFGKREAVLSKGYSPLLSEVQDRLAALFADLANYPIDGVMLQDDLILHYNEDLSPQARALYKKATGREADPARFYREVRAEADGRYRVGEYSDEFREWRRWERDELLALAVRLRAVVHQVRPRAPFGLNLYYETLTAPDRALEWYAQDLEATLAADLDFYALMLYHRQMETELNLPRDKVFALIEERLACLLPRLDFPARAFVKLQTSDWDTRAPVPAAELAELIGRVRTRGPVSLCLVANGQPLPADVLQSLR